MSRVRFSHLAGAIPLLFVAAACGPSEPPMLVLETRASGTSVLLQAVSPASDSVVWVSGHGGTWGRSLDGGVSWTSAVVPGAETLEFRDVEAFDADRAVLLSAGSGPLSRVFRTDDGGATWTETFRLSEPTGFLDCMAFLDDMRGFVYGDAVDGSPFLLETDDGGRSWARIPEGRLPPALDGEGGFAASGTCVTTRGSEHVAVGTGAGPRPRLIRSDDGGETWETVDLPLTAGPSSGATAVGIGDDGFGWAVGGAIGQPIMGTRVAVSHDDGRTWAAAAPPPLDGPLYGAARVPGLDPPALVVVGPGGIAWSRDGGAEWLTLGPASYWAVAFAPGGAGWAVGPGGRITALRTVGG